MLFDDDVAGEPRPVHPVADHVFHVGPARLRHAIPERALVPDGPHRSDVADRAVAHALLNFDARQLATELRAGHDAEARLEARSAVFISAGTPGHVHPERLLEEGVLARLHNAAACIGRKWGGVR